MATEKAKPKSKAEEIISKFKKAKQKRQHKDPKWAELDKFDRSEQWDASKLPPWVPQPVTNFIHLIKTTKRAAFAIENPVAQIRPLSYVDQAAADTLNKVYRFEWDRMKCRSVVRDVLETGKLLGTGIAQVYWEETEVRGGTGMLYEGEMKVRQIDPASFYPDPNAFTIEDCEYIHLVERKSVAWLKRHPLFGKKMKNVEARMVAESERGEIYERYNDANTFNKSMIDFHTHYTKKAVDGGGFKYSVYYLAGETILHEIDQLEPNCYPFAVYYDYKQRQDFWGKSTCEIVLDNQKLINKVESIIALIGTQLQSPQTVISKQSGLNPRDVAAKGSAPGIVWVANGRADMAMTWRQPPPIPQALFNLAEQAKENIREVTGITQAYMGQGVGSLQTSSGVSQLIDRATMRDRDQMFDLELFIEDLSKIMLQFIVTKHVEERYARYQVEESQGYEFIKYTGADFQDIEFDLHVDVSAEVAMSRQRLSEEADNLLNVQGQYGQAFDVQLIVPEEYVELKGFANKDRILERMRQERIMNYTQVASEVSQMMFDALQSGVPQEEVDMMGQEMMAQRFEQMKQSIGSANASQIHNQQAGAGGAAGASAGQ